MQEPASPDLFVTTLDAPPGAPWDQHRAARIAAELGAPLPLDDLDIAMSRLGRWRSNAVARFAVGYRRAHSADAEDRRTIVVDGQAVVLTFRSAAGEARRRRRFLTNLAVAALVTSVLAGAFIKWSHVRDARADALQRRAEFARHQLSEQRRRAATARGLALMARNDLSGRSGRQVAGDLVWLGLARDRSVSISAVRWQNRRLAVQASGAPMAGAILGDDGAWIISPEPPKTGPSIVSRPSMRRSPR